VPIVKGASMVRLVSPHGWCHEGCILHADGRSQIAVPSEGPAATQQLG
jgi:hypothetical protein